MPTAGWKSDVTAEGLLSLTDTPGLWASGTAAGGNAYATLWQRTEQAETRVHEAEEGVGDLRKVLLRQAEELDKYREFIIGLSCRIATVELDLGGLTKRHGARLMELETRYAELERREGSAPDLNPIPALALDTTCRACGNPDAHYWDGLRATYCSLCAKDAHLARLHPWRAQAWSAVRRLASAVRFLAPAAVGAGIALGVAAAR